MLFVPEKYKCLCYTKIRNTGFIKIIFINSVPVSQKTHFIYITDTNQAMLLTEIIIVLCVTYGIRNYAR